MKFTVTVLVSFLAFLPAAHAGSLSQSSTAKVFLQNFLDDLSGYGFENTALIEGASAVATSQANNCEVITGQEAQDFLISLVGVLTFEESITGDVRQALGELFGSGSYRLCDVQVPYGASLLGEGSTRTIYFNEVDGSLNFALRFSFID